MTQAPRRLRALVILAAVALAAAACADPSPVLPRVGRETLPGTSGMVLASGDAEAAGARVVSFDLASGTRTPLQVPDGFDQVLDGFWLEDEDAALVVLAGERRGAAFYRLGPGVEPQPVGERLGFLGVYDLQEGVALASRCGAGEDSILEGHGPGFFDIDPANIDPAIGGDVRVMDETGGPWRTVAEGCIAALSPDASAVVHSPDAQSLWITSLATGRSRKVTDVKSLGVRPVGTRPLAFTTEIAWSEQGIAATLDAGDTDTVVTLDGTGEVTRIVPMRPRKRDFLVDVEWSPSDGTLAMAAFNRLAYVNVIGFVALLPEETESYDVISVQSQFSERVLWSEDGSELLVSGFEEPWIVTRTDGTWVHRVPYPQLVPLDWKSS